MACAAETRRLGALISQRSALILSSPILSSLVAVDVRTPSFSTPLGALVHPGLDVPPPAANTAAAAPTLLRSPAYRQLRISSFGLVVVFVVLSRWRGRSQAFFRCLDCPVRAPGCNAPWFICWLRCCIIVCLLTFLLTYLLPYFLPSLLP